MPTHQELLHQQCVVHFKKSLASIEAQIEAKEKSPTPPPRLSVHEKIGVLDDLMGALNTLLVIQKDFSGKNKLGGLLVQFATAGGAERTPDVAFFGLTPGDTSGF